METVPSLQSEIVRLLKMELLSKTASETFLSGDYEVVLGIIALGEIATKKTIGADHPNYWSMAERTKRSIGLQFKVEFSSSKRSLLGIWPNVALVYLFSSIWVSSFA